MRIWRWAFFETMAVTCYATLIEPNWIEVTHHRASSDVASGPIKVRQISDLHIGSIGYRERRLLDITKEQRPDVIVLSGDIIEDPSELPELDKFLSALEGGIKVAVLGNWEHWGGVDLAALRRTYEKRGVTLLVNEVQGFHLGDGRKLSVWGLDDFTGGKPDLSTLKELAGSDTASLVIQHSPGWFDQKRVRAITGRFELCLSGHTHGGQVTFLECQSGLPEEAVLMLPESMKLHSARFTFLEDLGHLLRQFVSSLDLKSQFGR